jgi:uncharacterized OB-fold protein
MKLEGIHIRPTAYSANFWDGCRNNVFRIQRCGDCGKMQFYPRVICSHCWSKNLSWVEIDRVGEIYSYTTVHRPPSAEFRQIVPYTLVYVRFPGEVSYVGYLLDAGPAGEARIGAKVEMCFERINEEVSLPVFKLM